MPAYNAGRFLSEAIESILDQSFRDFEFLIHDDGSTDDTLAIALRYEEKDARIRVSSHENRGIFATRNAMMDGATGEYFAVMDADDISLPERFAMQVAFLDANPDHVVVGGQQEWMDEDGYVLGPKWCATSHVRIDALNLNGRVNLGHPTAMLRGAAVRRVNGYDPEFRSAGDLDLWLRMAEIGRIENLPDIVLRYRLVASGISGSKGRQQKENARRACELAWVRRGIEGRFDYKEWRAAETSDSRYSHTVGHGWLAWNNDYRRSWRRYALKAIRMRPLCVHSWRLLVFGFLKRPKNVIRLAPEARP